MRELNSTTGRYRGQLIGRRGESPLLPIYLLSIRYSLSLLLLCWVIPTTISAQSSEKVLGLRFVPSLEWGVPTSIERGAGLVNTGDLQSSGTGKSQQLSWLAGVELGNLSLQNGEIGFGGGLHLSVGSGYFLSDSYRRKGPGTNNVTGDTPLANYQFRIDLSEVRLEGELFGLFSISNSLKVGTGGWVGYRLGSTIRQEESIVGSENVIFSGEPDPSKRVLAEGESIVSYPLRFGARVGLRWYLGDLFGLRLEPEFSTRFDAQALFQDGLGINAFSGRFSLGILLLDQKKENVSPDQLTPPPPLLSAGVQLRAIPSSSANIRKNSEGNDSIILRQQIVTWHRYLPFPSQLHFSPVSGAKSHLYNHLAADTFQIGSLSALPVQELLRETVNILGWRMREYPESSVRLTGERGEDVRTYLHETWRIDSGRVEISEGDTNRTSLSSPDSFYLHSESLPIIAPLSQRWTVEEFQEPQIAIQKQIIAEAGLSRWQIQMRQGERTLAEYRSDSVSSEEIGLQLVRLYDQTSLLPIEAELIAEDVRGVRDTAYGRLSLHTDPNPPLKVVVREYWFPIYREEGGNLDVNSVLLDHLVESAGEDSEVEIRLVGESGEDVEGMPGKTKLPVLTVEGFVGKLFSRFEEIGRRVRTIDYRESDPDTEGDGIGEPAIRVRIREGE